MARFLTTTVCAQSITARRLLTAFGIKPLPAVLEALSERQVECFLRFVLQKQKGKRLKIREISSVDQVVACLKGARRIMVITGAGVGDLRPDFLSLLPLFTINKPLGAFF